MKKLRLCPYCKQELPKGSRRVCARCEKPILKHHKYTFVGSSVMHRDCEDPEGLRTAGQLDQTAAPLLERETDAPRD